MAKEVSEIDIKNYLESLNIKELEGKTKTERYAIYIQLSDCINEYNKTKNIDKFVSILSILKDNGIPQEEFGPLVGQFSEQDKSHDDKDKEIDDLKEQLKELKKTINEFMDNESKNKSNDSSKSIQDKSNNSSKSNQNKSNNSFKPKQEKFNTVNRKKDSTFKQVKNICVGMKNFYDKHSTEKRLQNIIMGTGLVGTTALVIPSFLIAKATLKLAKKTIKLGAKGSVAVSKLAFKAAKGTAKIALEKAEENRRNKSTNIAALGKIVSEDLVKYLGEEIKQTEVKDELITDVNKKEEIDKIRKGDLAGKSDFQTHLKNEYTKSMMDVKQALYKIRNAKIYEELSSEYGLSSSEISTILNEITLDEEGRLVFPKGVDISSEKLKGTDLEKGLKKIVRMPKINALRDSQIFTLVKAIKIQNGEISFDLPEETREKDRQLSRLANFLSGKSFYKEGIESNLEGIEEKCEVAKLDSALLDEIRVREEFDVAVDLKNQMNFIFEKVVDISSKDKIISADNKQRETLRKIAEKKVKGLENAGIVVTIQKGKEKSKKIVLNGREILNPLKSVEKISDKKLQEMHKEDDEQELN